VGNGGPPQGPGHSLYDLMVKAITAF
jgi:hypothetical protein